jgi:hypothetical protein
MYFANITSVNIDVDGSGTYDVLKNLTARAKVNDALMNNAGYYETVAIEDGERPDIMSKRLYQSTYFLENLFFRFPKLSLIHQNIDPA